METPRITIEQEMWPSQVYDEEGNLVYHWPMDNVKENWNPNKPFFERFQSAPGVTIVEKTGLTKRGRSRCADYGTVKIKKHTPPGTPPTTPGSQMDYPVEEETWGAL